MQSVIRVSIKLHIFIITDFIYIYKFFDLTPKKKRFTYIKLENGGKKEKKNIPVFSFQKKLLEMEILYRRKVINCLKKS